MASGNVSKTAAWRRRQREEDPEKYRQFLDQQKLRYQERKKKREEYWATGTRTALEEKESYYENKRRAGVLYRKKVKASNGTESRVTRTAAQEQRFSQTGRANRQEMTEEERIDHDKAVRTAWLDSKSRQKRQAMKTAKAEYMRQYRLKRKLAKSGSMASMSTSLEASTSITCETSAYTSAQLSSSTSLQPSTSTPQQPSLSIPLQPASPSPLQPFLSTSLPPSMSTPLQPMSSSPLQPFTSTPLQPYMSNSLHPLSPSPIAPHSPIRLTAQIPSSMGRPRRRQHCYNVTQRMKSLLKKSSFSSEESAHITSRLMLRRTPQKRKENLDHLLEYPEVQSYCRKKLRLEDTATKSPVVKRKEAVQCRRLKFLWSVTKTQAANFYKNPAVSRVLPHKRYATKLGPGYAMVISVEEAHKLFMEHYGKPISYSLFADQRPKNVKRLGEVPVDTCLCITCTNVQLKIVALNRLLKKENALPSESKMLKFILCPYEGDWPKKDCVYGNCKRCSDRLRPFIVFCRDIYFEKLSWMRWERKDVEGADKKLHKKLDVESVKGTVGKLLDELEGNLDQPTQGTSFIIHLFQAYWQQKQYELCKNSLKPGQVLLVQDFAENRKATYGQEVKSAHFGKAQISLHPTVAFYRLAAGQLIRHVAMFFSDDIGHDYHAVHCYTEKMVEILKKETSVEEVIIWSDGAASQYKGRGTFADLSLYPFPVQRNFFGSDHGKGEADGETGRFSQAMKRAVGRGQFFRHAQDMVEFGKAFYVSCEETKYSFVMVERHEIKRQRPEADIATVPGTRSLHQLVKKGKYLLDGRRLSCFCDGCPHPERCLNSKLIEPFQQYKLKPSNPSQEVVEDGEAATTSTTHIEPVETVIEPTAETVFTSTEIPQVGQWLEVMGTVQSRKAEHKVFHYANVVEEPAGRPSSNGSLFWCLFFKQTQAGYYTQMLRPYEICMGMSENYEWRVIPAPHITSRNHVFSLNF